MVGFIGGIDFNNDRFTFLYDVHCSVRGPAVHGILSVFNERWEMRTCTPS
jgi:phosphatidylserine/phosphatidylglycerophosphate/cardiolipin synthase-like enzyme